jgi:ferritin-like metal-binding protein YciE
MLQLASIQDLFSHQLGDLHSAEMQIAAAMPQLIATVEGEEAAALLRSHLQRTEVQVKRLEDMFAELALAPTGETSLAMEGLLRESGNILEAKGEPAIKDAAILAVAQLIARYEIAAYTIAKRLAVELGYHKVADSLERSREEEEEQAEQLTALLYSFG